MMRIRKTLSILIIVSFVLANGGHSLALQNDSEALRSMASAKTPAERALKEAMSANEEAGESLEAEKDQAYDMLKRYGQKHLLAYWDELTPPERAKLLQQIASVDWDKLKDIYERLVIKEEKGFVVEGEFKPSIPIPYGRPGTGEKGEEILRWGASEGKTRYGVVDLAGGRGSRLDFKHAKGLFDGGCPLSETPFYEFTVKKLKAAARHYGHKKMYPLIIMTSSDTHEETKDYFEKNNWFGEKDRIMLVPQYCLPVVDKGGKAILKSKSDIIISGAGHGDALDYVLQKDEVIKWLGSIGVEHIQYMNVDNLLSPLADACLLGEHALSRQDMPPGRVHITIGMIKKTEPTDKMANVVIIKGQKESIDYRIASYAMQKRCEWGNPSIAIVTIDTLKDSEPIFYSVDGKTDTDLSGKKVDVLKFERSINDKRRYGVEVALERSYVYAPIKYKDGDSDTDTPSVARRLHSEHYKRILRQAGYEIPDSTVVELPCDADYIPAEVLRAKLRECSFPQVLGPNTGYLVMEDFSTTLFYHLIDYHTIYPEAMQDLGKERNCSRPWALMPDNYNLIEPEELELWMSSIGDKKEGVMNFTIFARFEPEKPSFSGGDVRFLGIEKESGTIYVIRKLMTEEEEDHCSFINTLMSVLPAGCNHIYQAKNMYAGEGKWSGLENAQAVVYPYIEGVTFEDFFKRCAEKMPLYAYSYKLFEMVIKIAEVCALLEERKIPKIWDLDSTNIIITPHIEPILIDYTVKGERYDPISALESLLYCTLSEYYQDPQGLSILQKLRFVLEQERNQQILRHLTILHKNVRTYRYATVKEFLSDLKKIQELLHKDSAYMLDLRISPDEGFRPLSEQRMQATIEACA